MRADIAERYPDGEMGEGGLFRAVALALLVHALIALLFYAAYNWAPSRSVPPAAGSPMVEASLMISTSDVRASQKAMRDAPKPAKSEPAPAKATQAQEDTVPPPQPLPEPRPQDATTPQQQKAQQHIPVPDNVEQERASELSVNKEKEKHEQEAKHKQEQQDLTEEREKQKEAEQKRRLAAQQAEEERQKKLAEIRKQREALDAQIARDAKKAEDAKRKLLELAAQRAKAGSTDAAAGGPASPGQNGTSEDLSAKYAAAIQQAVLNQWVRPDSVPLGQKCSIHIRQIPGGTVIEAKVDPSCPYDDNGRRSVEAAVLRAQPLPYRGFETVFQRSLTFNFTAQDR